MFPSHIQHVNDEPEGSDDRKENERKEAKPVT